MVADKPPVLTRNNVPVLLNLPCPDFAAATKIPRGELRFQQCRQCGFLWNAAFDPALTHYDGTYENNQMHSTLFDAYINETVRDLVERNGLAGKCVIEAGCGQGDFLKRLVKWPGSGISGVGFDPAYKGKDGVQRGAVEKPQPGCACFVAGPVAPEAIAFQADAVISRHVIEHIPAPRDFLVGLRSVLSDGGRLFLETPCADWILDNRVMWDFFYEHCSLFTVGSLVRLVEKSGFRIDSIQHRFGGQYLWLAARRMSVPAGDVYDFGFGVRTRQENEEKYLARFLRGGGGFVLWGAGAKGVTFANLVDPTREIFTALVDINPEKQGKFIPCSGHPIIAPEELRKFNFRAVIILNSNYRDEIASQLKELGISCELVDIEYGECHGKGKKRMTPKADGTFE